MMGYGFQNNHDRSPPREIQQYLTRFHILHEPSLHFKRTSSQARHHHALLLSPSHLYPSSQEAAPYPAVIPSRPCSSFRVRTVRTVKRKNVKSCEIRTVRLVWFCKRNFKICSRSVGRKRFKHRCKNNYRSMKSYFPEANQTHPNRK